MTGTTHSEFGHDTEGSTVAQAFADRIRGKTILITGVNRGGLGYSAAHALVCSSLIPFPPSCQYISQSV